jgi:Uma2 family endonuclease
MLKAIKPSSFDDLYKQLADLPENMIGEIIEGQLYAMTRPFSPHVMAAGAIPAQLWTRIGRRPPSNQGGWIFLAEPELHLQTPDGTSHVLVPDLAAWKRDRLSGVPLKGYLTIAPDWVCEVLSDGTARKDKGPKRRVYHQTGVSYLWLVDPVEQTLEAYRRDGEFWVLVADLSGQDRAGVEPFTTVELELESWWEDVEKPEQS